MPMSILTSQQPIGLFDSGLGGLTVMKEVMRVLPDEELIYFADTARIPYGEKSRETIVRFCLENALFLMEQNIKVLVVACNTASAFAIDKLRQFFSIPIIDVIQPGINVAIETTRLGRIGILGTRGTIQSQVYPQAILKRLPTAHIISIACPLFVPLVEEKMIHHPIAQLMVKEYLAPLKKENIDTLLLGCTHYPLLRHLIEEEMGQKVKVIDSASSCAEAIKEILIQHKLCKEPLSPLAPRFFVSDDPQKFQKNGTEFLGSPILSVLAKSFNCL